MMLNKLLSPTKLHRLVQGGVTRRSRSSSSACDAYDVLLCGGGVVGVATLSNMLRLLGSSHSNIKVGIVDARGPPSLSSCQEKKGYDLRVYALAPQSIALLQEIGAWKYIEPRSQPYYDMQIWDQAGPGVVKFSAVDSGVEELGRLAEDSTIQAALYQTLEDNGFNVTKIFGATVSSLEVGADTFSRGPAKVTISPLSKDSEEKPREVHARLVIGADGGMSAVRKLSNISTWGWNYGQEGLVATVKTSLFHTTAWQRYLKSGPLALLPLWNQPQRGNEGEGGHSSIVWSVPVSEANRLKALNKDDFLHELNTALQSPSPSDTFSVFEPDDGMVDSSKGKSSGSGGPSFASTPLSFLKKEVAALADSVMAASLLASPPALPPSVVDLAGPRVSFPLQLQQAQVYSKPRVVLVGDAAHSVHPQAGQGLNLGLGDAKCLSQVLADALGAGADIGDPKVLSAYSTKRYAENLAIMGAVDTINNVFKPAMVGGDKATKLKNFVRSAGMLGVHALPSLKNGLASVAMKGFGGANR
jgi:ubiquinone biosynthesis monooxygenase Coq6